MLTRVEHEIENTEHLPIHRAMLLAPLLLVALSTPVQAAPFFGAHVDYGTTPNPNSVAIADLNADGRPDLAVAGVLPPSSNKVSVLLGNGDGTFGPKTDFDTGPAPQSVAIADLNADGRPDLAVANVIRVSVLLGNGNGTFGAHTEVGIGGHSVAIADLNADGRPDLAVAGNGVSVMLGNGNGTFGAQTTFGAGNNLYSVAIADLNGDGRPDLVTANASSNTVSVLLGRGDGTFATKTDFGTGSFPFSVAIADLDADGRPDLAVANYNANNVSLLLGNGDGTFAAKTDVGGGTAPASVAIADVNADGHPDLAIASSGSSTVSVLLGNGDAAFNPQNGYERGYSTGSGPWSVGIADFNADTRPDLAVANLYAGTVSVLMNRTVHTGPQPIVDFDVAPASGVIVHYAVPFAWHGTDLDGTVSLYRYGIDPPPPPLNGDPVWIETGSTSLMYFFQPNQPPQVFPSGPITFYGRHTFMIKAVDNDGLESDPESRSFITSNVAPEVQIVSPASTPWTPVPIGTSVTIRWEGTDSDGVYIHRPIRYKYRLFATRNFDHPEISDYIAFALSNPGAMRDHYAPSFSSWDSAPGESTSTRYTSLVPGDRYLFCVVAFDEGEAYSARFTQAVNMVELLAGAVPDPIAVSFDVTPNTLNLASQGLWITGFLEPPAPFAASEIDASSILLNESVPVDPVAPTAIGDHDGNGVPDLMVKFKRVAVELTLSEGDHAPVNVTGTLGSAPFQGTDYIRVHHVPISAPVAGSHLTAGSVAQVRWQTPNGVRAESAALLHSFDGGSTWSLIARGQSNIGSYDWTVPNVQTAQAKVAVVLAESADESGELVDGVLGVSEAFSIDAIVGVDDHGPAQFALRGVTPNPAQHELRVSFSLRDSKPATLALFDVSGRQLASSRVEGMGTGWHTVTLGGRSYLPAGLYVIRLAQDGRSLTARAAVVR